MWLTVPGLTIGRFILGFGGGLCIVSCSVWMSETVPALKLGTIGTAVNTGIVTGLLVTSLIQGFTLPAATDTAAVDTTTSWRIGFLSPGIFAILNIGMWLTLINKDSLFFLIDNGNEEQGLQQFKRIYLIDDQDEMRQAWEEMK